MVTLHVFDPPLCCPTGVCGPAVDPQLVRFAADLAWLGEQGVTVSRHTLSQEPAAFVAQAQVKSALEQRGDGCLPIVMVDDEIRSEGSYPSRAELASWSGVASDAAAAEPPKLAGGCCGGSKPAEGGSSSSSSSSGCC